MPPVWSRRSVSSRAAVRATFRDAAGAVVATRPLGGDATWKIVGAADIDGDGRGDLLWNHVPSGGAAAWLMADTRYRASAAIEASIAAFVVASDVNGDGTGDTVWSDRL